jgi:hypothetical protein
MAGLVNQEGLPDPAPMAPFTLRHLEGLAHDTEPVVRGAESVDVAACPRPAHDIDSIGWMCSRLVDHWNKRREERQQQTHE